MDEQPAGRDGLAQDVDPSGAGRIEMRRGAEISVELCDPERNRGPGIFDSTIRGSHASAVATETFPTGNSRFAQEHQLGGARHGHPGMSRPSEPRPHRRPARSGALGPGLAAMQTLRTHYSTMAQMVPSAFPSRRLLTKMKVFRRGAAAP